jgi:hypothetical protein
VDYREVLELSSYRIRRLTQATKCRPELLLLIEDEVGSTTYVLNERYGFYDGLGDFQKLSYERRTKTWDQAEA